MAFALNRTEAQLRVSVLLSTTSQEITDGDYTIMTAQDRRIKVKNINHENK